MHVQVVASAFLLICASCAGKPEPTAAAGPAEQVGPAPMATFDQTYQAANRGQVRISVPEVYELVNVAITLTPFAQESPFLVAKDGPYYQDVMNHFTAFQNHPFILALEERLRADPLSYRPLKMNGVAFEFRSNGTIVGSRIFERTSHPDDLVNPLFELLPLMQDFSDESDFREFYAEHQDLYRWQAGYLREAVGVDEMMKWLQGNFPEARPYDFVNIVFSPLVGGMQSTTWFESDGFKELQPHVNFRYNLPGDDKFSSKAAALRHGFIIFTELNHGFIDAASRDYADRIDAALESRAQWVDSSEITASYAGPRAIFDEMMNWGLVGLYLMDKAPTDEVMPLVDLINQMMERRGFRRFSEFNSFLMGLYRCRPAGTPISSVYPTIVEWFETAGSDRMTVDGVACG